MADATYKDEIQLIDPDKQAKATAASESALNDLLCVLNDEIRYVFDHDDSFLDEFAKGEFMDLTEVSFTSHHVKIVYILNCGQHVADTIAMDDYFNWRNT